MMRVILFLLLTSSCFAGVVQHVIVDDGSGSHSVPHVLVDGINSSGISFVSPVTIGALSLGSGFFNSSGALTISGSAGNGAKLILGDDSGDNFSLKDTDGGGFSDVNENLIVNSNGGSTSITDTTQMIYLDGNGSMSALSSVGDGWVLYKGTSGHYQEFFLSLSDGTSVDAVSGGFTFSCPASIFNVGTAQISQVVDPTTAQMAATKNYVDTHAGNILSGTVTLANGITTPVTVAVTGIASTSKITTGIKGAAIVDSIGVVPSTNQIIFNGTSATGVTIMYIAVP